MRILNWILMVAIAFHACGCSHSDLQKEVDKARAETEVARADAAAARAELAEIRAALPEAATKPLHPHPKTELAVNPTMKGGLYGSGVATFADGKKRPFVSIRNLDVSSGQATAVGIVGNGERELSSFKFYEVLSVKGEPANKGIGYKERDVLLNNLSRISFGPEEQRAFVFNGVEFEMAYCQVELEATDGTKESFPCILADYPHHRPLTISVQYADGIGKEKLEIAHLYGMTFRASE